MSAVSDHESVARPSKSACRQFLFVFNPVQNRKRQAMLSRLIQKAKQLGLSYELYPTEANLSANLNYFTHNIHNYTDVVVLGGDGTLNVIINCLLHSQKNSNHNINLGVLPAGTGNDFASRWYDKSHYPTALSADEMINIVLSGQTRDLHLGECHIEGQTRYFHNVLGVGFDAAIAKQLTGKKAVFQSLSYILAAIRHIPFYQEPHCALSLKGENSEYNNLITAFANSKFFGGGLPIAPDAHGSKAELTMVRAGKLPFIKKMDLLLRLTMGKHLHSEHVTSDRLTLEDRAKITTPGLEIEADGEFIGYTPCSVKLSDKIIKVKI